MHSKNGMKLKRDYNRGQVKLKSEVATCCNFETEQSKRSGARLQKKDFTGYSLTVVAGTCNQSLNMIERALFRFQNLLQGEACSQQVLP